LVGIEILRRLCFAIFLKRFALLRQPAATAQPYPTGLAKIIDLSALAAPNRYRPLRLIALLCSLCYVAGVGGTYTLGYLFLFTLVMGTLQNSQGAHHHDIQAPVLVLCAQTWASLIGSEPALAFFWSQQVIVALYFTSGLTKLIRSGKRWILDAPNFAIQMLKGSRQTYYSTGKSHSLKRIQRLSAFMLSHPNLCRLFLAGGLALELIGPVMLVSPSATRLYGIALLLFHWGTKTLMTITFTRHVWLIVVFLLDPASLISAL